MFGSWSGYMQMEYAPLAFKLTNAFQVTLTYLLAESVRNPH
jgi:hypothetical protein